MWRKVVGLMASAALVSCGGGGESGGSVGGGSGATASTGTCSLAARQNWAFATLDEWYLFPETLPAALDPAPYASVDDYVDALTATARGQGRDRYFTYLTSIKDEDAYYESGATAGFGFRIAYDTAQGVLSVSEAFEGAPALAAGVDRGDRITAIGTTAATLRNVSDILASEGEAGVSNALGPSTAGTTRALRVSGPTGDRTVTVTKADYTLIPVSSRYGAKVIDDGGRKVGYFNLRTFITAGDGQMRQAFAGFRAQGITDFVVDLRYNGGGLVSSAELLGDLLGQNRFASDVFSYTTYRPEKSSRNDRHNFDAQPQSVSPMKIAFIGTEATASASELVINAFIPYLGTNMALVGGNTYGKPVGQIAIDRAACDDRLRVIAFALRNAANSDAYFSGLAATVPNSCSAPDDLTHPLGDVQEASLRGALDFLAGRPCGGTIAMKGQTARGLRAVPPKMLAASQPTLQQRDVPGLF